MGSRDALGMHVHVTPPTRESMVGGVWTARTINVRLRFVVAPLVCVQLFTENVRVYNFWPADSQLYIPTALRLVGKS